MAPRAKKTSVEEVQEAEKSEGEDDNDEYYLVQPQQQSRLCLPETVNPVCNTMPQVLECIQTEENMPPEHEKEQGLTNQEENLPELEDNHTEDPPIEIAVPYDEELQRPRRQQRQPKVFTYIKLSSPTCCNVRAPQQHNTCRVPWTYTVQPCYLRH